MTKEINLTYTGYNISDMLNDLDSMFTYYSIRRLEKDIECKTFCDFLQNHGSETEVTAVYAFNKLDNKSYRIEFDLVKRIFKCVLID